MKGWIYLIRNGDLYKIGVTQNLDRRLKELKPDETICTVLTENYLFLEKQLHKRYKNVRIPQSEYFRLSKPQLFECKKLLKPQRKKFSLHLKGFMVFLMGLLIGCFSSYIFILMHREINLFRCIEACSEKFPC